MTEHYASVNGLNMYYEVHGEGAPLVLLHGAYSNIQTDFGQMIPGLARNRRVIGVEQQAHGHTADIDRPLSYEQMADDTAALLRQIGVEKTDFFAYSFGGGTAFQIALRHPDLVRKLVCMGGTAYSPDGMYPELLAGMAHFKPEMLHGTPWHEAYLRIAPKPEDFLNLVTKKMALDASWTGLTTEQVQSIKAPVMIVVGDSDIVRPEHAAEFFRLLGGGVIGDMVGLPQSALAVLPRTTHVTIVYRTDWLLSMVSEFLDA